MSVNQLVSHNQSSNWKCTGYFSHNYNIINEIKLSAHQSKMYNHEAVMCTFLTRLPFVIWVTRLWSSYSIYQEMSFTCSQWVSKSVIESVSRSVNQPVSKSVSQSVSKPVSQSVSHSVSQSINQMYKESSQRGCNSSSFISCYLLVKDSNLALLNRSSRWRITSHVISNLNS